MNNKLNELYNNCTDKETLVTYLMFRDSPHITLIDMVEEEGEEMVQVGFNHYSDDMLAYFVTGRDVGELMIAGTTLNDFGGYTPYGLITREKLFILLESLPHINNYLFEVGAQVS